LLYVAKVRWYTGDDVPAGTRSVAMQRQRVRVFYHPQRGVFVSPDSIAPMCARYRGGSDSDWRELSTVEIELGAGGSYHPVAGQSLPRGFLWGDPSRQLFGLGGPAVMFGPPEKVCRSCREPFTFTAAEQKHWYEELGFLLDSTAVHCRQCRAARRRIERHRRAYALALRAVTTAPSAQGHLAVARAVVQLIRAGGQASIEKALGHCTRARRFGARASADRLSETLRRLRDASS
jgi:hypothetical protein